jgi:hypothetical protein
VTHIPWALPEVLNDVPTAEALCSIVPLYLSRCSNRSTFDPLFGVARRLFPAGRESLPSPLTAGYLPEQMTVTKASLCTSSGIHLTPKDSPKFQR